MGAQSATFLGDVWQMPDFLQDTKGWGGGCLVPRNGENSLLCRYLFKSVSLQPGNSSFLEGSAFPHPHKEESERKLLSVNKHHMLIYLFLQGTFIKH